MKYSIIGFMLVVVLYAATAFGWAANVVKFVQCDFQPPYKAEVVRGVGIFIVPLGVVEGYLTIQDGNNVGK